MSSSHLFAFQIFLVEVVICDTVTLFVDAALTTTVIIDAMLRLSNSSNPRLRNLAQIYLSVS